MIASRERLADSATKPRLRLAIFDAYYRVMYGNSKYLTLLLDHLDRVSIDVNVLFPGEGPPAQAARERGAKVTIVPAVGPLNRFGKQALQAWRAPSAAGALVAYARRVARELRRINADVLYVTSLRSLLMAGPAARSIGVPSCLSISVGYRHRLDFVGFALASRIAFLSERLRDVFGVPPYSLFQSKFRVNPIGLELEPVERIDLRSQLGLPPNAPIVGVSGMLVYDKGIHDFVAAARDVLGSCPDAHFIVIGDASPIDNGYANSLRRLAAEHGVDGRVHFLGWRKDAQQLIAAMDLYCLPSYSEGVPRSILEALWAGVPVVATNAGATADLVTPETGFLTEPGDVRTLATSIVKILGDPELARRLGRAGHELVAAKHSIDGHCVRLEAILREIAGR